MRQVPLTSDDILIDTQKVTTGYFSGGLGTILGSSLSTASLSATQKKYYTNLQYSSADHFSVTFGNIDGSGSSAASITAGVGETEAVYKSYASMLLRTNDIEGGFKINSSTVTDKSVYILLAERARMKDRLNPGNWTLALSGSNTAGAAGVNKTYTDDSKTTAPQTSPIGPRYNVYEGSAGTVSSTTTKQGYFWPDAGCIVLSATSISASIPGTAAYTSQVGFGSASMGNGLAPNLTAGAENYHKLATAIVHSTTSQQFRSEEDQTSVTYFCRALSREFNASSNPTFTSGSEGRYRQASFEGNPQTFITTVGLYNNANECVAVGRLSKAILKNYSTEAIIKTTLKY